MRNMPVVISASLISILSAGISFAQTATVVPPGLLGSTQSSAATSSVSSPITPFAATGMANVNFTASKAGACSGITCTTGHTCECDVFNGNLTVTATGAKKTLLLNITTDDTAGTSDGNGSCFPGTGYGTLCNLAGKCLGLQTAGNICTSKIANPSVTAELTFNLNEIYYLQPEASTGKFAGFSGGGSLAIANDLQGMGSTITKNVGYASMLGTLQP
jgi:hypothetical protein